MVGSKPDSIFLVFEYCDHDFASLMDNMRHGFSVSEIKCILLQVLKAVAYMHRYPPAFTICTGNEFYFFLIFLITINMLCFISFWAHVFSHCCATFPTTAALFFIVI